MNANAEPMRPGQLWLLFGLIGLVAGAMSIYFGYAAWVFAIMTVGISFVFSPRAASMGGALAGIGVGSGVLLWWATRCPPATSCEPGFRLEPFVALVLVTLTVGLGLSLFFVYHHSLRRAR